MKELPEGVMSIDCHTYIQCSKCSRKFGNSAAFEVHARKTGCIVGTGTPLVGELARDAGIIWRIGGKA